MKRRIVLALVAALFAGIAGAAVTVPAPPQTELHQRLGEALPQALHFIDADGRAVQLSDYLGDARPLVLVLGYHRCPNLCGLVMHGVLEALADGGLPRSAYRVLVVSIDP